VGEFGGVTAGHRCPTSGQDSTPLPERDACYSLPRCRSPRRCRRDRKAAISSAARRHPLPPPTRRHSQFEPQPEGYICHRHLPITVDHTPGTAAAFSSYQTLVPEAQAANQMEPGRGRRSPATLRNHKRTRFTSVRLLYHLRDRAWRGGVRGLFLAREALPFGRRAIEGRGLAYQIRCTP
jgi:hypothetical protein